MNISKSSKRTNILDLQEFVVSPLVGIIRSFYRIPKDAVEPDLPYVVLADVSSLKYLDRNDFEDTTCSGVGMTLDEAMASAMGEAIERYCSKEYDRAKLFYSSYGDLKNAVGSSELVLYSKEQYESGLIPYVKFPERKVMGWVQGRSLLTGANRPIPAVVIYHNYEPSNQEYITAPTSNGAACGPTYEEAVLRGLFEVVERDAFMITWLCRLPMPNIIADSLRNKKIQDLLQIYKRKGLDIVLKALLLDTKIPTYAAIAIDRSGRGPPVSIGLASRLDPEIGILKALYEVEQIRPTLTREKREKGKKYRKLLDFRNVRSVLDHNSLYLNEEMLQAFDFLLQDGRSIDVKDLPQLPNTNINMQLKYCLSQIKKLGSDVIAVDITTPDIKPLGLSVAHVLITYFQPIHFGYHEARLGGSRLFTLPEKLGFYDRKLVVDDLNPFPHPLG